MLKLVDIIGTSSFCFFAVQNCDVRTVWLMYSFVVVGEILNIEINANPGFLYQIYMSPYRTRYLNAGGVEVEFEPGSCSDTPSCSAPARSHSNLLASSPPPSPHCTSSPI